MLESCVDGSGRSAHDCVCDTINLKYAENLKIVKHQGFTEVTLNDPWNKGKVLHKYILIPDSIEKPSNHPEGTVIRTPIKRAVIASSVHCGLIISFGKGNCIKGVCEPNFINIPFIKDEVSKGTIADCGSGITPTLEKIIDIDADAIIISPFQNNGGYGRLNEWGNPIIEAAEYMETSALGRAEWMRFYGMLFGAEKQADELFLSVERNYNKLKKTAQMSKTRKSVIMDKIDGSVWYVPGGQSTIGRIIADANAKYSFSSNKNSGGVALPFELVLEKAGEADIWMFRYNSPQTATRQTLLSENKGYSQFKAYKDCNIYGCNTNKNTFYEDTPFHPDLLLRDFIIITHPELNVLGEPRYFEKLK